MFNLPSEPYIKNELTGKLEPQAGVFLLDMAYGGVKLSRMSLEKGCTGQSNITGGFDTKKVCYDKMQAFIRGIEIERELA